MTDQTFMTPREFAKVANLSPQQIYNLIRRGVLKTEQCQCGRNVLNVPEARQALVTRTRE